MVQAFVNPKKYWSFFPTPSPVIHRLLDYALIENGMRILEPSAGTGNICRGIKDEYPDCEIDCFEIVPEFRTILTSQNFNVISSNFMGEFPSPIYDRVIANPPFDKQMTHVQRMYKWLKPGGRMVTVVNACFSYQTSSSLYFEFRHWLRSAGAVAKRLPTNSFVNSERPTQVETAIIIIDKHHD